MINDVLVDFTNNLVSNQHGIPQADRRTVRGSWRFVPLDVHPADVVHVLEVGGGYGFLGAIDSFGILWVLGCHLPVLHQTFVQACKAPRLGV